MSAGNEVVNVRLLDREYTIGVEPGERESLLAAARLLDAKMREVRGGNRMAAIDRVAVLAALNMAHELHQLREDTRERDVAILRGIQQMQRRLDALDGGD